MKKVISFAIMAALLIVLLCACSGQNLADMASDREINVTGIPEGWQSEYEWNSQ